MIPLDWINCVRWSPHGDMLASASDDRSSKVIDFKTGKVIASGTTPDGSKFSLFSFLLF